MLDRLVDWTTTDEPIEVTNLRKMNTLLEWDHTDGDLEYAVDELNDHIEFLRRVPLRARLFAGTVAKRIHLMQDTCAVRDDMSGTNLLLSDFATAHEMSHAAIQDVLTQLETYGLGGIDEMDTELGIKPAIRLRALGSGWQFWLDIIRFSEETNTPLESFVEELDFSPLDE